MDDRKYLSLLGKPQVYIPISSIMALLSITILYNLITIDKINFSKLGLINIGMNAIGLLVLAIIFISICSDFKYQPFKSSIFNLNVLFMFILILNNTIYWFFEQSGNISIIQNIVTATYILANIQMYLLKLYINQNLPEKKGFRKTITIALDIIYILTIIILITNRWTRIVFFYENDVFIVNKGYPLICIFIYGTLFINVIDMIFFSKENTRKRIVFSLVSLFLLLGLIFHNPKQSLIIISFGMFISLLVLYTNIQLHERLSLVNKRKELSNVQAQVMMNKIQPHFLYNSLASISSLCEIDPALAKDATDKFADYLRMNLLSIQSSERIPFSKELEHIQTYLWLGKLRFEGRLNVEYEIETDNFTIPPLSIQPLVENAVRHGILKKVEGGSILIKTQETEDSFIITIKDDGVGFDQNSIKDSDEKVHVGIESVKERIEAVCNGTLTITSVVNKETIAVVTIPKN